jgi:hypothetical protein
MALNKRKSTYIVLIAILLINLFMVSANAVEHEEKVITPRFSYINFFQNDFSITSYGKSQMSSYLYTYNSEEVRITGYLQQYKDGSWKNVKNWTKSIDGTSIMLTKEWYIESEYSYRYVSYGYVYVDGVVVESTSYISNSIWY